MKLPAAALIAILAMSAGSASEAATPVPEGWTMEPGGQPKACAIDGPVSGDAKMSLATEGLQVFLLVSSPQLPNERTDGAFDVQIDGGDWIPQAATAVAHTAGISIGGSFAHAVAKASRIAFRSGLGTWTFTVHNVGAAMDAVTTCAGEPTLAERDSMVSKPIPGAGGWKLVDQLPDTPGTCSARLNGREVDTMVLSPAPDGTFVLIAGRTDWATWGGDAEIGLAIDGAAPERLKATSLQNLVFLRIADVALARRLRGATSLDWTLPTGHFHAEVKGLGAALDAVTACQARRSATKG